MDVRGFATLVVLGFTVCVEFGSWVFLHPVLWGLPVEHHLRVEQGLLWTFGRVLRLPPIQKLITWIRLLHAAHLLQDLARSIENVTLRKEFACVNSFRNQLQRYAGMSPSHLRVRGGFQYLLNKFRARCAGVQDRGTR